MGENKKITLDSPDLLVKHHKLIVGVYRKAVHDALLEHKKAGNPVAVWRKKKIVLLQPDEIVLDQS